jgi:hypothetical protein
MKYRRLGRNGPMVMKRTTFQRRERLLDGKLAGYLRPRFLAIILLVITMSTVSEADCWDDSLNQVNRDILVMDSGAVYQVVPSDVINSVFWLPLTNATVCDSLVDVGGRTDDLLPDLQSGYRCIGLGGEGTLICFGNLPRSERFRIVKIA